MDPLFTIATITHNSAPWVREAIESVLASTYQNFEYIIADDLSTDGTWDIVKTYNDPRIRAWRNTENIGEYPNRNKVLFEARGKFIFYIDGDDILYKDTLETLHKYITFFPAADMIWGVPASQIPFAVLPYLFTPEQINNLIYFSHHPLSHIGLSETIFNTEQLRSIGGFKYNYLIGDTYIKRKLALISKVLLVPEGLSFWRQSANQASQRARKNFRSFVDLHFINKEILKEEHLPFDKNEAIRNIKIAQVKLLVANTFLKRKFRTFLNLRKQVSLPLANFKYLFQKGKYNYKPVKDISNPLLNEFHFKLNKPRPAYTFKPLVSVIMPVYNAAAFLSETVNCILKQTYNNIELIIINDGSADDSEKIIQSFTDTRIRYFYQKNTGQSAASNFGISKARGEYIKFFDADDLMNPEHIYEQVKKSDGNKDAIASCAWGRFYDGNPQTTVFEEEVVWKDMKPLDWLKSSLSQGEDMMAAWLWLIPKKLLQKAGGWDERLTLNNDFEFSTRLLLCSEKILFTPTAKVYYRSGVPGSLSLKISEQAFTNAYLSTYLGCSYLLKAENSDHMKMICANRYQEWIYRMYPHYPLLMKKFQQQIDVLGGSDKKSGGGVFLNILSFLFGWKRAKKLKIFSYRMVSKHE